MWVLRALAALMLLTGAAWADSLVSLSDQTSALGYAPAAQLKVTVNGAVTTLGAALAASGGCTTNCNFSTPTITGGSISGAAVAATTVNATANSGYSLNGVPVIGNNLSNSVGPSVGPAIQFTVPSIDLAQFSNFIRQNQFNTTLAPSAATNTIFENFTDFLTLNGPGAANGEINLMVLVSTINSGATWQTGENYESSMINNGTIGGYTSYTALAHNGSTGTATRITGLQLQPENDNATAGSWITYVGIECNPVSGPGGTGSPASQPTNSYCFQNSDVNQVIATAGRLSVGNLGGPASDIWLQVTGPDTSASTYNFLTRDSGSNTLFYVTDAGTAWLKAGLTLAGITGSTQCLQASSTGLVSGTGAACGSGSGGASLSVANTWTAQQTFSTASGTSVTIQGPDTSGGTFPFVIRNSAGNIFFITDSGAAQFYNALTIGSAGTTTGQLLFQNTVSGNIILSAPGGALGNVGVTLPDVSTTLAGLAVAQTFTAAQTFSGTATFSLQSGTAATYACFTSAGLLISSATAC